jgi:hypothetical protein
MPVGLGGLENALEDGDVLADGVVRQPEGELLRVPLADERGRDLHEPVAAEERHQVRVQGGAVAAPGLRLELVGLDPVRRVLGERRLASRDERPVASSASIFALNAIASSTVSPALRLNVLPVASRQS